ncbi:MAG: histidinol-phosphate transaminase [Lachnospiraceae bacterium]|nr:histidinol-phosphate transaminase [Lachnospiraceae bacterium]
MSGWKDNVRVVEAYVPGDQPDYPDMVKINTNENPYPPSPKVMEAVKNIQDSKIKLYPNFNAQVLVSALSKYHHIDEDKIFVGVGSDDVLAMAFLTFFNSKKPVLFPNITYSFYKVWAGLYQIPYETPLLDENFRIKKEDYYKENGGVVIANPNAPTGICEGLDFIEDILQHNRDVVVIVDEAYVDFGGTSAKELIDKYDNLLVVQTFSKSRAMAGVRIGYCMGNKELIKAINTVKHSYNSYTMNYYSIVAGVASLSDKEYFDEKIKMVINTRERVKKELEELGFICTDSKTNFLFAKHKSVPAKEIFESLRSNGIFVRYFNQPIIDNYLRISIGTDEEMDRFLDFLRKYFK